MQILIGSKREITIMQWGELIEKQTKKINNSLDGFLRFSDIDSLDFLIQDCQKLIKYAKNTKEAIHTMDNLNIK